MKPKESDTLRDTVRSRYAQVARTGGSCCGAVNSCCTPDPLLRPELSRNLGYSEVECNAVPEGANMGLGCGNPQAIAALSPGETVLDLGCGGGFDCFLAARQVGEAGRVIGVDMTPEMIAKARENARQGNYANVEFRLGEIEHLPAADASVDVIISNCVINLSPCKEQVFADAFRVLRPGGRLAISDVVMTGNIPEQFRGNPEAYCGCVAGAAPVEALQQMLEEAGFIEVALEIKPESREIIAGWFPGSGVENYVASATIQATKKGGCCCGQK
ncbi:MAG: arsenite methyltransferase [Candidatus Hydrogenedentes bacterium]|nr:arsenite methyltransferase [Candidatus Hydrogenedentota bacterium]